MDDDHDSTFQEIDDERPTLERKQKLLSHHVRMAARRMSHDLFVIGGLRGTPQGGPPSSLGNLLLDEWDASRYAVGHCFCRSRRRRATIYALAVG